MYINYSTSSGLKTAAGQISAQPGSLMGFDAKSPTTGYNIFTIYDSEDSNVSGKLVIAIVESDAGMVAVNHEFFCPVNINRGIYVAVSGTGTDYSYIVRFAL
jgi:hypothetical protein